MGSEKHGVKSMKSTDFQGRSLKVVNVDVLTNMKDENFVKKLAEKCPNQYERRRLHQKWLPRNHKIIPGACMTFNISQELVNKYSLLALGDIHEDQSKWWNVRLEHEVLYLENFKERFELVQFTGEKTYRFATVNAYIQDGSLIAVTQELMHEMSTPLLFKSLRSVKLQLKWEEIKWADQGVFIQGTFFEVHCFWWMEKNWTPDHNAIQGLDNSDKTIS